MADIEFTNSPGGYSLNTQFSGGGLPAAGGPDMGNMGSFFAEMARRKMEQAATDRRRAQRREMLNDRMARKQFDLSMRSGEQGLRQGAQQADQAREAWERQKQAEDAPAFVGDIGGGAMGGFIGQTEAMPWQRGAANSGFTRAQINAMKPQNATFGPGAEGPGLLQGELAARSAQDDEDERRRRMARELSGERMTGEQAGWGLGYQPIGR